MSYQFKNMAREFDLPLVLLHQMNRGIERENIQRATKKEPEMKDLDQAGERPSDVIIMITHEKEQKVIKSSKIWIVKNRFGATGSANVKFEAEKTWFRDLTQEELEELEPDIVK
jgi:replicative DNA helicase